MGGHLEKTPPEPDGGLSAEPLNPRPSGFLRDRRRHEVFVLRPVVRADLDERRLGMRGHKARPDALRGVVILTPHQLSQDNAPTRVFGKHARHAAADVLVPFLRHQTVICTAASREAARARVRIVRIRATNPGKGRTPTHAYCPIRSALASAERQIGARVSSARSPRAPGRGRGSCVVGPPTAGVVLCAFGGGDVVR